MVTRKIQVDVEMVQGVGYSTHAQFIDINHDIIVDLLFELGTGKVLEARTELIKRPFPECDLAMQAINNLIGFQAVNFGSRKDIFRLVAGPQGCTHLAELVMESINARIQAADSLKPDWIDPQLLDRGYKRWENAWAGSCIHYNEPYWKPHDIPE